MWRRVEHGYADYWAYYVSAALRLLFPLRMTDILSVKALEVGGSLCFLKLSSVIWCLYETGAFMQLLRVLLLQSVPSLVLFLAESS